MTDWNEQMPLKKRVLIYGAAWLSAGLLLLPYIPLIIFFPLGLGWIWVLFGIKDEGSLLYGWLIYFVHAVVTFAISRKGYFYTLFYILVVLLLLNVGGCYSFVGQLKDLH